MVFSLLSRAMHGIKSEDEEIITNCLSGIVVGSISAG